MRPSFYAALRLLEAEKKTRFTLILSLGSLHSLRTHASFPFTVHSPPLFSSVHYLPSLSAFSAPSSSTLFSPAISCKDRVRQGKQARIRSSFAPKPISPSHLLCFSLFLSTSLSLASAPPLSPPLVWLLLPASLVELHRQPIFHLISLIPFHVCVAPPFLLLLLLFVFLPILPIPLLLLLFLLPIPLLLPRKGGPWRGRSLSRTNLQRVATWTQTSKREEEDEEEEEDLSAKRRVRRRP